MFRRCFQGSATRDHTSKQRPASGTERPSRSERLGNNASTSSELEGARGASDAPSTTAARSTTESGRVGMPAAAPPAAPVVRPEVPSTLQSQPSAGDGAAAATTTDNSTAAGPQPAAEDAAGSRDGVAAGIPAAAGPASASARSVAGMAFEQSPLALGGQSLPQSSSDPAGRGGANRTEIISNGPEGGSMAAAQPPAAGGPENYTAAAAAAGAAAAVAPPESPTFEEDPATGPAGVPAAAPPSAEDAGSGMGSMGSSRAGPPSRQGLHASRYRELAPSEVAECAPHDILRGISLSQQRLGRGSFGIVMAGAYGGGLRCAVKIMVADHLDKSALRELLLAPAINHANLVQTYTSRCARLTHEFFDLLEAGLGAPGSSNSSSLQPRDPTRPRVLLPIPLQSGDGFGDPGCGVVTAADPYRVLHMVLHDFVAKTEQFMVVIVQELCTKGTLHAAIRQGIFRASATNPQWNLRLARRALLRTAMELARGLLHLHDTGVVHGDLKPQNVLLCSSRDDRRGFSAKVADFGLVHVLPQHANSVSTDSFGSPAYMAPEAFAGKASKATDVYAFGVCLWELLCGRTPYSDAHGVRDLVAELAAGRAPALAWPDGAEMADGIIALGRACMSSRPEDRPDFKEVLQELVQIERIIRAELLAPMVLARALAAASGGPAAAPQGAPPGP